MAYEGFGRGPSLGRPYERTPADLPELAEVGSGASETQSPTRSSIRDVDGRFSESGLLSRAQHIFTNSTHYLETNLAREWERNLAHFKGKHAPGSKYTQQDYRRSQVFRPKTRSSVKKQEAGLATAMFSTTNLIDVQPQSPANKEQAMSAAINKELLQHRLENTIPWVLTVEGAFQDSKVYGLCITHQYWQLREMERLEPAYDEMGEPLYDEDGRQLGMPMRVTLEDKPCCDNIAPENFRFDVMADWRDPANTSPFLILVRPMRAVDAELMMEKNGGYWMNKSRAEIISAGGESGQQTRRAREGYERTDSTENAGSEELTTVWAHMNIIREDGEDWVYWTMGTTCLLTEPVRLMEAEPWLKPGERPFTVGFSAIETHKSYPISDVGQLSDLQQEINETANLRIDNVRLSLSKRYLLKRGDQIDTTALTRNIPGSGVYVTDTESSIKEMATPDVTSSSYREQEVLASEVDMLVGGFDSSKAASDGASPGGLARAGADASEVQDYSALLFIETWVKPTLSQLLRLEQAYENDATVMALAAEKAGVLERFGTDEVTDDLLTQNLIVRVDAGIGTMDPIRKVERLANGIKIVSELPNMAQRMESMAVANEIMGSLGYSSAERFFLPDQEWQEKQQEMADQPSELTVKMRELDIREADNTARDERERAKLEREALQRELEVAQRERKAAEDRAFQAEKALMDDQTKRDIAAGTISVKDREVSAKARQAAQPARES